MKKLNKKSKVLTNSVQAYACANVCHCISNPCTGNVQGGAYTNSIVWANIP